MRSNRQFALTTEGAVFYNHVKLVMKDVSVAVSQLNMVKEKKRNTLRLAVSSCISEKFFLPSYERFLKEHGEAQLIFTECTSQNAFHQLESEAVDAVIAIDCTGDDGPFRETLLTAPMQIYVPVCEWAGKQQLRVKLKEGAPVVFCDDSPRLKKQIVSRLDIPEGSVAGRLASPASLTALLQRWPAIAIAPGFVELDVENYCREAAAPALFGALVFCWREKESSSRIIEEFLSCLIAQMGVTKGANTE